MKLFSFIFWFFISLLSCSNLSHNQVRIDMIRFTGGIYRNQVWNNKLNFRRVSWYHGITMYFDMLYYSVDLDSPFYQWFGPVGAELAQNCSPLLVAVQYSSDSEKIAISDLKAQMEKNGLESVVLRDFGKALKSHPEYQRWNLRSYEVTGYCRRKSSENTEDIILNFPGFREVSLPIETK